MRRDLRMQQEKLLSFCFECTSVAEIFYRKSTPGVESSARKSPESSPHQALAMLPHANECVIVARLVTPWLLTAAVIARP